MKNASTIAYCGVAFAALAALPASAEVPLSVGDQQQIHSLPTIAEAIQAAAAEASSPAAVLAGPADNAAIDASETADPFAQAVPLSDADLDENRGGQSIVVGNQTLQAVTSGNFINGDIAAGAITLSDGALSNFNGVGNFAINTGAQVSLQSGMNLVINISQ